MTYRHLLAIAERLPAAWRPPSSAPDLPIELARHAELALIASPVAGVPVPTARALARHHDVVASAMDADALLPFRFGTVLPAADVDAWLAAHAGRLRQGLGRVRGAVEMSVRLLRLHCAHAADRTCRECAGGAPGVTALRAVADRLVERAGLPRWRYRSAGGEGNAAASLAFLVPRADVAAFLSRIAPVASRAEGLAVVPTGPWPPYSFTPALDRAPLARAAATAPEVPRAETA